MWYVFRKLSVRISAVRPTILADVRGFIQSSTEVLGKYLEMKHDRLCSRPF
jgi:hypothetical protein